MSLSREEVIAGLTKILKRRDRKKFADVQDDTLLFSGGLKLDSFAVLEFVPWLGKKLGKRFTAEDVTLEDLDTIKDIMVFVEKHAK